MLIFLRSCLATLPSILLSRAALELENLALRHQIGVLQRSARSRDRAPQELATKDAQIVFRVLSSIENASFAGKGLAGATSDSVARKGVGCGDGTSRWAAPPLRTTGCLKKPKPLRATAGSPWAFEICARTVSVTCVHQVNFGFRSPFYAKKPKTVFEAALAELQARLKKAKLPRKAYRKTF